MPKSAKPRKKYKPGAKPVTTSPILMPHQKDNLAMATHMCAVRAHIGLADEEDFHTVACALNVAYTIASRKEGLVNTMALLETGLNLIRNVDKNLNAVTDMKTLAMAIEMADSLNSHVTSKEYVDAVQFVLETAAREFTAPVSNPDTGSGCSVADVNSDHASQAAA